MVRADLLAANAKIFAGQGKALNDFASRNVKVRVPSEVLVDINW